MGAGVYLWTVGECDGGDETRIGKRLTAAKITHALVKVSDGIRLYNDQLGPLFRTLRDRAINTWPWAYLYGSQPEREAAVFVERVKQLRPLGRVSGVCLNCEVEFKRWPDKDARARILVASIRAGLPNTPIMLSSYYLPRNHPEFPWRTFFGAVDLWGPQVYWHQRDPAWAFRESVRQAVALGVDKGTIIPTGPAYDEAGGVPTRIRTFQRALAEDHWSQYNYWDYQHAFADDWQAVGEGLPPRGEA